ncbi:M15 family metallopeptidase [Candidatus Atelocyanobacterium thalassae]|uniref:D-alanyl-D-alanine dipeptidase n=1 Tax=cyanobacterium endosymbiont of Braarudosphaera bigelowii TaxID=1285375 RepID=A0ABM7UCR7_9CHRO|nr:M15 family metallopeptidase [Candidatus Atelocyanobacterium thalassa]BDA40210.1 D-alanyl-D-alanine dipeptidase [cyanobacterium endosymbiont of Braarudosphaera bigelowii]
MKNYSNVLIQDCKDDLVPIPLEYFSVQNPHPYKKLGATYKNKSPYYLRSRVLEALQNVQNCLQTEYGGWKLHIFDAYRPIEVQQFMVDYTFSYLIKEKKLTLRELSILEKKKILNQVYKIWAIPSEDYTSPPPHSTGAAIDLTLVDCKGNLLDMGCEIDDLSEKSQPFYYSQSNNSEAKAYNRRRGILNKVMSNYGFLRHPNEWWHFSQGDQMWAWQSNKKVAYYGRV